MHPFLFIILSLHLFQLRQGGLAMKMYFLVLFSAFALIGAGCSKTTTPAATTTTTTNDFASVYNQMKESAPVISTSRALALTSRSHATRTAITALWDPASTTTFPGIGSTGGTLRDFLGGLFDASEDQSIFGRSKMPFLISCTMDVLGSKTGDLLTTGTQTITFTSSVVGVCGTESDYGGGAMIGQNASFVIENLTDTTNYDQKVTMSDADNALFTSDQWMYIRNNSTTLNFMHIESNASGSEITVSSIAYNKTAETGVFQMVTKYGTNDARIFRIVMDVANNDFRAYGHKNAITSSDLVSVNAASNSNSPTEVALSIAYSGLSAPYDTDLTDGAACVTTATGAIAEDNTLTCTTSNKTALAVSGATTIETAVASLDGAAIRADADSDALADNLPTFTAATILSAGFGL